VIIIIHTYIFNHIHFLMVELSSPHVQLNLKITWFCVQFCGTFVNTHTHCQMWFLGDCKFRPICLTMHRDANVIATSHILKWIATPITTSHIFLNGFIFTNSFWNYFFDIFFYSQRMKHMLKFPLFKIHPRLS
jgi:hypothetical protein